MSVLFIPSLIHEDEVITIDNLGNITEAESFLRHFDSSVSAQRRLKHNPEAVDESYEKFTGLNLQELIDAGYGDALVNELMDCVVPGKRGIRAVLMDVDTDEIFVGTTVVYNKNWAMLGVDDTDGVTAVLLKYAARFAVV